MAEETNEPTHIVIEHYASGMKVKFSEREVAKLWKLIVDGNKRVLADDDAVDDGAVCDKTLRAIAGVPPA